MSAILECRDIVKQFGGLVAVDSVTFDVNAGEIFGLIGPNGAGKTTLFRVISGVYPATSGTVIFKGKKIGGLPPHAICRLGVVSTHQIVRPFPNMTVRDNVRVGAEFGRRGDGKSAASRVLDVLEFCGLTAQADKLAKNLTLAGRKRLEIARALSTSPELVLLDEVIAGLNPTETAQTMDLIRQVRNRGITVVMVEHVMKAIMGVSDRIMVLDYGDKIAEGSPSEIARNDKVIQAYLGKKFAK
jgi:branched-chain amino acid transport system ATP-binding protein